MQHKAENGGTNGRARIGYRNVRIEYDGRLVNSIALDEERAPLVRKAFELYATGDYSLEHLYDVVADLGLTTRPTRRWPSQPVSVSKLHRMMRDPYYTGDVPYKGELYQGRHPAIIDRDLFDRVQAVMDARSQRGTRDRVHYHYLKGMLFCGRCEAGGRRSRLIYTEANGRGDTKYEYFFCRARQDKQCDLPHLPVEQVELAVLRHYVTLQLPEAFTVAAQDDITSAMANEQSTVRSVRADLKKQLSRLDVEEERLIDLAVDDSLPKEKLRARLRKVQTDRTRLQSELTTTTEQLALGAEVLRTYLELLADPQELYRRATDASRRVFNTAFYVEFKLDDSGVTSDVKTDPVDELHDAARAFVATQPQEPARYYRTRPAPEKQRGPSVPAGASSAYRRPSLADRYLVGGSSKGHLVGETGFEPAT